MLSKTQPFRAPTDEFNKGLFWGFISYLCWGFFPIYWRLLADRMAVEILAHRMIWAFLFYLLLFAGFKWNRLRELFYQKPKDWILSFFAAIMLAINWGLYVHAVNSNQILEGSLAYFINPILNVAVGVIFFREALPWPLKFAVFSAFIGVIFKMTLASQFPWIALTLAFSFCAYGVMKKQLKIPVRTSSLMEGLVSLPIAAGVILFLSVYYPNPPSSTTWVLFVLGGVVTGLPLFLFSYAAQRIPYSIMGILQFIAPSLQFLVAVHLFGEPLQFVNLISFGFIWLGVFFYIFHSFLQLRRTKT